jgi:hypothetical protein
MAVAVSTRSQAHQQLKPVRLCLLQRQQLALEIRFTIVESTDRSEAYMKMLSRLGSLN